MDQALKQWLTGTKRGEGGNTKIWISRERKELFRWNKNACHSFWRAIIWWKIIKKKKIADKSLKLHYEKDIWHYLSRSHLNCALEKGWKIDCCIFRTYRSVSFQLISNEWIFSFLIFLAHFWLVLSFYIPWKHQKSLGFLVFSGGIK